MNTKRFRFKQFEIEQDRCSMKIGSDAVLLASLIPQQSSQSILDIGTGTGVIALMLAQKFTDTCIDAIEIDEESAKQASENFYHSPWAARLNLIQESFFTFQTKTRYDLIVCNPPFYLNALSSGNTKRDLARHASIDLFRLWLQKSKELLSENGQIYWILPAEHQQLIATIATDLGLHMNHLIRIYSYPDSATVRIIVGFVINSFDFTEDDFVIYENLRQYSEQYRNALIDYFIIF